MDSCRKLLPCKLWCKRHYEYEEENEDGDEDGDGDEDEDENEGVEIGTTEEKDDFIILVQNEQKYVMDDVMSTI